MKKAKKSSWIEVENAIREFCTSPDTELHVITIATSVRKDARTRKPFYNTGSLIFNSIKYILIQLPFRYAESCVH